MITRQNFQTLAIIKLLLYVDLDKLAWVQLSRSLVSIVKLIKCFQKFKKNYIHIQFAYNIFACQTL